MKLLLSPLKIGSITVHNRLVMPPMATFKSTDDRFTEQVLDYYKEKTDGAAIGLAIVEHCFVSPEGKAHPGQISISEDGAIPGLKRLADIFHANGSKALVQISHAGAQASAAVTGLPVLGASSDVMNRQGDVPQEMTLDDIHRITACFASAALRAKEAGFEGIELHGAHGYMLSQFLSPLRNHRTDEYGGPVENRVRFHCDCIKAIREATGPDFVIAVRLGAADYPRGECEPAEGGLTEEDGVRAAVLLEQAGADLIDVSGGLFGTERAGYPGLAMFTDISAKIKKAVSIPVAVVGRITTSDQCEAILENGDADMVGAAAALLKDSDWAKKMVKEIEEG